MKAHKYEPFIVISREELDEQYRRKEYTRKLKTKHTCRRCGKTFIDFTTKTIKDGFCKNCVTEAIYLLQKKDKGEI